MEGLRHEWATNLAWQATLPERTLDWPGALAMLQTQNLKLRQARTELTNAQEAVRQVFRDLVPMLNLHAGVAKRLVDVPTIGANDVSLSADSFFNIPGLVSFGARLYITRLGALRAESAAKLTEREEIISLYRLFWEAEEVQAQAKDLQVQRETAQAFSGVDLFTSQLMLTEAELRETGRQQSYQTLQQRISETVGDSSFRWRLVTNGLPAFSYATDPLPLSDTNRVGQLQMRLAAIELEAARAALAGIKLRYWPELNIFVTGPPLYQRNFGQEQFWSAGDLRASADAYWTIDTRGYVARQVRQTKRQQALQEERMRQQALTLMGRLLFTQQLLQRSVEQEHELQQELMVLEAVPPAQNFSSLQKFSVDYQNTTDQLRRVRRDIADLNALFWFVDEAAWVNLSPLSPLADARKQ